MISHADPFSNRAVVVVLPFLLMGVGLGYLSSMADVSALFIIGTYFIIFWSVLRVAREEQDWFNPLMLVVVLSLIRFSVPWLLSATEQPPDSIGGQRLTSQDWQSGHLLALLGLLGVILGWYMHPKGLLNLMHRWTTRLVGNRMGREVVILWAGMMFVLGMIGLTLFIIQNVGMNVLAVITSGAFRSVEVQEGTGVFFYLAHAAIPGSVLLTSYFILKYRCFRFIIFTPVIMTGAAFFVLGGRSRSVVSIACSLIMIWHVILNRKLKIKWFFGIVVLILFITMFAYAGQMYRGGSGLSGLSEVFSFHNLTAYVRWAAWSDFGQLHGLAGATAIGPGVLKGRSFISALGNLNEWLGLRGKNAGISIAERIKGFGKDGRKWGFHPSLIGESYLNFGLPGTVMLCAVWGALLKSIYRIGLQMLGNPIGVSFCSIILVYSLRVFFSSSGKIFEMFVVLFWCLAGPLLVGMFQHDRRFAQLG